MGITHLCFGLSYLTAFGLEMSQSFWPRNWLRWVGCLFGIAGLLAHTIFMAIQQPTPASPYGSLLLLAWVFAVFYLYGALHRRPFSWTIFVLTLVLILVWLSYLFPMDQQAPVAAWISGERFWGMVHGGLLLGASVGITLGFLVSLMYLIQARRLRQKRNPLGGMKLLSLERLETINRRAINVAFPLLSVGLLLGVMQVQQQYEEEVTWTELKILSTAGLWLLALLLMYLRYGVHLPARRLASLTIVAFGIMLLALVASHPFVPGDSR